MITDFENYELLENFNGFNIYCKVTRGIFYKNYDEKYYVRFLLSLDKAENCVTESEISIRIYYHDTFDSTPSNDIHVYSIDTIPLEVCKGYGFNLATYIIKSIEQKTIYYENINILNNSFPTFIFGTIQNDSPTPYDKLKEFYSKLGFEVNGRSITMHL